MHSRVLFDMDIPVLKWPSRSPYTKLVENLWEILAQRVYKNGRQYESLEDLKDTLTVA